MSMMEHRMIAAADPAPVPRAADGRRLMSIRAALEWAFGTECARLDFEDRHYRDQVSTIWVMIQRGNLGCKVDGGGHSAPADDADIIAGAVAALPEAHGGRAMAARIAEMAAGCLVPDAMVGAVPRCVPTGWERGSRHGQFAETEKLGKIEYVDRGRRRLADVVVCPVSYTPTWSQIHAARRFWLQWWGALLHLQTELQGQGGLASIALTPTMPPMTPWRGS